MAHDSTLTDQQALLLHLILRYPLAEFVEPDDVAVAHSLQVRGLYRQVISVRPRPFNGIESNRWFELTIEGDQALRAHDRPARLARARRKAAPEMAALLAGVVADFGEAVTHDFDIPGTDAVESLCRLVRRSDAVLRRIEIEAD